MYLKRKSMFLIFIIKMLMIKKKTITKNKKEPRIQIENLIEFFDTYFLWLSVEFITLICKTKVQFKSKISK